MKIYEKEEIVKSYICEVCNNAFEYKDSALRCEAKHAREAKQEACKDHNFEYELDIEGRKSYGDCYSIVTMYRTCTKCKIEHAVKLNEDSLTKEELETIFNRLINQ